MLPAIRFVLFACLMCACMFAIAGCSDAYGCPPAVQQFNAGCQVQQFVAPQALVQRQVLVQPQAFYAQPIVQQIAVPTYAAQAIVQPIVLKQRQAVAVPRVQRQVTRQRIIVR